MSATPVAPSPCASPLHITLHCIPPTTQTGLRQPGIALRYITPRDVALPTDLWQPRGDGRARALDDRDVAQELELPHRDRAVARPDAEQPRRARLVGARARPLRRVGVRGDGEAVGREEPADL